MSTGTRIVLGLLLFGAFVFAALQIYGARSLMRRGPDSPAAAARAAVQADNTIVGLLGSIEIFEPVSSDSRAGVAAAARVEARVVGARDSGRLIADLAVEDGRWALVDARFTLSDGTTIPVAGSAGR